MSASLRPRNASSALALAIHFAIVGAPLFTTLPAQAQQQVQRYDIPAGALGDVLSRYARESGVAISFNAEQVARKRSTGLQGSYGVPEGFATLLHGQGLQAQSSPDGYVLIDVPQVNGALELGATSVTGVGLGSTTEGTGSYTTGATNTATKLNMSLRETPQSVSVLTRQRIDDQNLRSIGQVLEQAPGLNVQSPGSDRLYVFSRGLAIDNYQFDGMPTTSFAFSQALPHALADMAIYDRVEVVRGATGLLSGAGDPSGTVNLVRKRPTDTFKGYVSAGLGSWDLYRTEVDVSGPLTDSGNVRGRAVAAYQQGNSFTDHLQQEKTILYGITEFDLSDSTLLTVGVDYLDSDPRGFSTTGLPLLDKYGNKLHTSRSDNPASRDSSNHQEIINSFASIEQKLANDWTLKLSTSYLYGTRDYDSVIAGTSTGFVDPATGSGLKYTATKGENWQKQQGLDLMLSGPFQAFGREHELVMGFNYQNYENRRNGFGHPTASGGSNNLVSGLPVNIRTWDNYGPRPTYSINREDDNLQQRQNGAYLATRLKPTDDLSLVLGARVSNYKYGASYHYNVPAMVYLNTDDSVRVSGEVTPYAGVVYDLDDNHSLYASYTSIFKPQTYKDQNGKLLDPREGDNYEIGLKGEYFDGRLNTAFALFEVKLENDNVPDGIIIGTDYDTAYAPKKTTTRGFEMEVSGEILPGWNVDASYSHSRVKDSEGERIKTIIPMDIFKLWTTYRLPGALERLTVGAGVNWQSNIHFTSESWMLPSPSTYTQDDYATVGLMARYQLTSQWSATATVNNLFDKKYVSSLDENFYSGSYGAPRNVMVTTKLEF
ncbi:MULTISPECIES: TonB-dependent siderophore receptor [unclassified Pseudomonas]|uniref:TonB-dependent siderophore receptor n=1 Tax=unclassified Pseudomonas TaxID=196821 RepID=UPI0021C88864|nr:MULTISPECIES: TonB-dependent receptor [unclassified Pseudomonas]MCU1731578.1 TonB-dependent receptor [Pseudomonas sp. 20P_3.2_Bac4]MCU1745801.1 TonB-dependent receptor [Pseudomonas sp. 20P_3.2_Bac5]